MDSDPLGAWSNIVWKKNLFLIIFRKLHLFENDFLDTYHS